MGITIEKIYYLENPEEGIKKCVTESQLKFDNIIKDIFGVAFVSDLTMMIQYNKSFQASLCKTYQISENEITLDLIFRVASREDLVSTRNEFFQEKLDHNERILPPFHATIQLNEGIFNWNEEKCSYIKVS